MTDMEIDMIKESRMDLFQAKDFYMHSGEKATWKIECDALYDEELAVFASIIAEKYSFGDVFGIPSGGVRLEQQLHKYIDPLLKRNILLVDDVYTTGASMVEARDNIYKSMPEAIVDGVVLFARKPIKPEHDWIEPVFQIWS